MGTKYVSQSQSGYNSSAPPDDGSLIPSNMVTWAGMKTKLGDPVLTLAQNMNTALSNTLDFSGRATATNDTCLASDHMKTVECTTTLTATLIDLATVGSGFIVSYKNTGTGVISINLQNAANTLDGTVNGTTTIPPGGWACFKTNTAATGYLSFRADQLKSGITSVTATQGTGALTFGLNPCVLDFRSTTLTTGVPATRFVSAALSLVLPSGGTLGAVTTVSARLILVAIDNAGTPELAVINIAGGKALNETDVINTTAISASSTANDVFYSTTARTGVAYRVVGAVDAVNTAGAWGNPTLVQGSGGNALTAMGSLGYGQTWQDLSASRTGGTTYYNTTGRPINVSITVRNSSYADFQAGLSVNGITLSYFYIPNTQAPGNAPLTVAAIVPPGSRYFLYLSGAQVYIWAELR